MKAYLYKGFYIEHIERGHWFCWQTQTRARSMTKLKILLNDYILKEQTKWASQCPTKF